MSNACKYLCFSIIALALLVLFHNASMVFLNHGPRMGHDYTYFFPYLLNGQDWVARNGWFSVPHFTPAFCAGLPWLANPQSLFWSLPQFLFTVAEPFPSLLGTYVGSAVLGAAATYTLTRKTFCLSPQASVFAAVLFLLNGFLFARMAVGHLTYHVVCAIPVLALIALPKGELTPQQLVLRILLGGLVFAAEVFGGALNFVIPTALSVGAIILIDQKKNGMKFAPWMILGAAGFWAILIAAIKLAPSVVFMMQYPRSYLKDHLFASRPAAVFALFLSFFFPDIFPAMVSMGPDRAAMGLHEFFFSLTATPFLLMFLALVWRLKAKPSPSKSKAALALLLVLLVLPILLTAGSERWGDFLMSLPVINNNTTMTRWWAIYILPLIVWAASSFDFSMRSEKGKNIGLILAFLLTAGQSLFESRDFYERAILSVPLDASAVVSAHRDIASGKLFPAVSEIGWVSSFKADDEDRATSLSRGVSLLPCYEPVFGYGLEMLPTREWAPGLIARDEENSYNFADPRCYLGSSKGSCAPGTRWTAAEEHDLSSFLKNMPFAWDQPLWQRVATGVTALSLSVTTFVLFFMAGKVLLVWSKTKRRKNEAP